MYLGTQSNDIESVKLYSQHKVSHVDPGEHMVPGRFHYIFCIAL
jgi:hypothetical protein